MNDKKLQRLAKKITTLEKDIRKGKNAEVAEIEMNNLIADLSTDELIMLDEYIQENNLIK